jgi:hypothetical protein
VEAGKVDKPMRFTYNPANFDQDDLENGAQRCKDTFATEYPAACAKMERERKLWAEHMRPDETERICKKCEYITDRLKDCQNCGRAER